MTDDRATQIVAELLDDPYGRWFVLVALIVVAVVVALLLYITRRRKLNEALDTALGELKVIRHEVKNDHPTNLRVEQDVRHEENSGTLATIRDDVKLILRTLGEHGYRIGELEHEVETTRDRRPER